MPDQIGRCCASEGEQTVLAQSIGNVACDRVALLGLHGVCHPYQGQDGERVHRGGGSRWITTSSCFTRPACEEMRVELRLQSKI